MSDKGTLYFFRLMFAFRLSLSFALAWGIALFFNLNYPYWALMTVVIVSMPTQGAMLNKFFARLIGTVLGIIVVNIIADISLHTPWVMIALLILWLSYCTYIAHCHTGMMTYMFSLSGYTSSILGFGLALAPNTYMVYYLSQARLAEITLGIVCPALIAFLLPSNADRLIQHKVRQAYNDTLTVLFRKLVLKHEDPQKLHADITSLCKQCTQTRELDINERLARKFDILAYFIRPKGLGGPLDLLSNFFVLRELYQKALANTDDKQQLEAWHKDIDYRLFPAQVHKEANDSLQHTSSNDEKIPEPERTLPPAPESLRNTAEGTRYAKYLEEITHALFQYCDKHEFDSQVPSLPHVVYRDHTEALFGALRLAIAMGAGALFWLNVQWDMGHVLLVLIGLSFSLGVTYPQADKSTLLSLVPAILGIAIAYVYLFVFYIQTHSLGAAMLITLPLIFLTSYMKAQSIISFGFWHVCIITFIFLCSYENTMQYNFSRFVNTSMASLVSTVIVSVVLGLIPQSGPLARLNRMQKRVRHFMGSQHNVSMGRCLATQSLIFSTLAQAADLPDSPSRSAFLQFTTTELEQLAQRQAVALSC